MADETLESRNVYLGFINIYMVIIISSVVKGTCKF